MVEGVKILLVDDNEWELFLHQELFSMDKVDCELLPFTSANDALNYLQLHDNNSNQYLILSDLNMPGMNGFEFLDNIKKLSYDLQERIKFFLISSTLNYYEVKKAKSTPGIQEFYSKPFVVSDFTRHIPAYAI